MPTQAELDTALGALCTNDDAFSEEAYLVVRDALAQDTAVVGQARRSQLLFRALRPREIFDGGFADGGSRLPGCDPSSLRIEQKILASATRAFEAGRHADGLTRCGDVLALAREAFVAGNVTDAVVANSNIERFIMTCTKGIESAPKEIASAHVAAYRALRATFPANLQEAAVRDRNEMVLFQFGQLRDRSATMPCPRAQLLAAANDDEVTLTRSDRARLVEEHARIARMNGYDGFEKYDNAYREALAHLDKTLTAER